MGECIIPLSLMYQVGGIGKYQTSCQVVRNVGCIGRMVVMEMSEDHPVKLIRSDAEHSQISQKIGCLPDLTVFIQSAAESSIHHDIRIRSLNEERINT